MWQQHLENIDSYIWMGYAVCLMIWLIKDRVVNSFLVSISVVVIVNGIMFLGAPYLFNISDSIELSRFIWYFTFALIDILAVILLLKIHKFFHIKLDKNGLGIAAIFILLMILQFVRYVDRQILGTDLLGDVYKFGIPLINIFTLLFLTCTVSTYKASKA
ncbi:MAG: hypothetical protein HRT38_10270 [Alteromonadaceae bacterium]|nr:hypothetical protein [Alteromonadaceae bacterium]